MRRCHLLLAFCSLRPDGDDAKADVVRPPLGLKAQPEGRPAGPTVVGPATATTHPRYTAIPIYQRRRLRGVQVGVRSAWQLRMVPVPAPLEDIAVHIMQAPRVGRVTADLGSPLQGWPLLGPVVRLALEVRLFAAQLVPERCGGPGPRSTGVFPLGFCWKPEYPGPRESAGGVRLLGQLAAKRFGLGEIDGIDREVVSLSRR